MRKSPLFITVAAGLFAASAAFAQDGGVPGADAGAGRTCGAAGINYRGSCEGNTAVFCSAQDDAADAATALVTEFDCSTFFPATDGSQGNSPGSCFVYDGQLGAYCAAYEGGPCLLQTQSGNQSPFACLNSAGTIDPDLGCVGGLCTAGFGGACTPAAADAQFTPTCTSSTLLTADCFSWGQPFAIDCTASSIGGTGCANDACAGIPSGGSCSDPYFKCADGLTCNGATAQAAGTCGTATNGGDTNNGGNNGGTADAGTGGGSSRRDDEGTTEPNASSSGCSATSTSNSSAPTSLALLGLLGLVAIRRRR